jgi:hypothetical protein
MAIDLDALRAKHEELSGNKPAGGNADFLSNFLQLQDGTNSVRILPGKDEDTMFYAETKIHRVPDGQGGVKNVHCRKMHGEPCPLCDSYYALWKEPNKDEDLARQIKPRSRYYMNVVDRESGDVKILSIGVILFKKIIAAMLDEDFGDITDLTTGHDFKIVKIMEGSMAEVRPVFTSPPSPQRLGVRPKLQHGWIRSTTFMLWLKRRSMKM